MRGLVNKVAVVTGGSGAIGRSICRRFAEEGTHIGIIDINFSISSQVDTCLTNSFLDSTYCIPSSDGFPGANVQLQFLPLANESIELNEIKWEIFDQNGLINYYYNPAPQFSDNYNSADTLDESGTKVTR